MVQILGVPIARLEAAPALDEIERLYEADEPRIVAYVNAHSLNLAHTNDEFRALLNRADVVLGDGSGVMLAAKLAGAGLPENLNGSDFNPKILARAAARGWPVYFLGARPGVADAAAARWKRELPALEVAGTAHGFFPPEETAGIAAEIRARGAGVLMVAMGNPLQELWIERHLDATGARIGVGVGAFFDFSAGVVPRSPAWMNRAGIEWIYRLYQEPRRMWRRYLLGNPLFLARVAGERFSGGRRAAR